MSEESTGFGSTFSLGNPMTLLELALITDMGDLPSFVRDLIDTTNFKSADGIKTYITSPVRDGNEVDFVMNLVLGSPSDLACKAAMADGKARPYKIVCTTATGSYEVSGNCLVRDYKRTNPMEDVRKGTLTIKYISLPTEAAGAGGGA
ncbi:hypothetical protein U1872_12485 [Sphingomonas sp. RB3P16]|uniref:hypothetical protein n=1 Tax=Parasphingomonas frigoris TaxID=3096163 RepID=UPI002FC69994